MTRRTYRCARFQSVGEFWYSADFSEASSHIMVSFEGPGDDATWQPVPFQVADTRHWRKEAERMIAGYFR